MVWFHFPKVKKLVQLDHRLLRNTYNCGETLKSSKAMVHIGFKRVLT